MPGHYGRDLGTPGRQPGLDGRRLGVGDGAPYRVRPALIGHECVDDDNGATRIVADAVGYVAEQELLPPRHAEVADHKDVNRLLLGGPNDCHRRIGIEDDKGMTALPCELPHMGGEFIAGCGGPGSFGRTELRRSRVLWHDHLHHEELRPVAFGEPGSPLNRLLGCFGPVSPNHHTLYRNIFQVARHPLILTDGKRRNPPSYPKRQSPEEAGVFA